MCIEKIKQKFFLHKKKDTKKKLRFFLLKYKYFVVNLYSNKNQSIIMKQIKFLLAIALVSVFVISCKETPKEEVQEEVVVEEVVEAPEVVVDSTAVEVVVDSTAVVAE
jgi:hypothetical protein